MPAASSAAKIGLLDATGGDRRVILDAADHPQLMYAAITRAVGFVLKANLPDRSELLFEGWDDVLFSKAMRDKPEHRVLRQHRIGAAGVGHDEPARSAQGRLGMTQKALVGIVPRAEAIGIGVELGEEGVQLSLAYYRRSHRHIGAGVAGRFQLSRSVDPLQKGCQFIGVDRGTCRRVWAITGG